METGLRGRRVLVTGGATGIGEAAAIAFAREGAHVAVLDINEAGLGDLAARVRDEGGSIEVVTADLSTDAGVQAGISVALERFGGTCNVLVNNVGSGAVRSFDDVTDEDWLKTINLNFMSYVRATRALLPVLRSGGGAIINVASDLARQPEPVPIDYSASKTAVLALTKGLARAEAPKIRVNAVAPGPIWTPFWTKPGGFAETMGQHHKMPPQEAVEHEMKLRQLPMVRLGEPQEVANVIVFLASDLASYVTSAVWGVDGGSVRSLT